MVSTAAAESPTSAPLSKRAGRLFAILEWLAKLAGVVVFGLVAPIFAWPAFEGIHGLVVPPPSIEWRLSEAAQRAHDSGDTVRAERLERALTILNEGKPVRNMPPPL